MTTNKNIDIPSWNAAIDAAIETTLNLVGGYLISHGIDTRQVTNRILYLKKEETNNTIPCSYCGGLSNPCNSCDGECEEQEKGYN